MFLSLQKNGEFGCSISSVVTKCEISWVYMCSDYSTLSIVPMQTFEPSLDRTLDDSMIVAVLNLWCHTPRVARGFVTAYEDTLTLKSLTLQLLHDTTANILLRQEATIVARHACEHTAMLSQVTQVWQVPDYRLSTVARHTIVVRKGVWSPRGCRPTHHGPGL